ncbi:DNA polymerase epsilon catalytic subunit A-like [Olea europaea var. sylvestris]|nr:DNA polymerase epsilon catalytic subunit A-like [Olea europaea var. sylvestris]
MSGADNWRRDRRDTRISKKQKLILNSGEQLESRLGYDLFNEGDKRLGWLLTLASSSWEDQETRKMYSCVDLYFVCQDGSTFKTKYKFRPYFYAATKDKMEIDVEAYLRRRYEGQIADIEIVEKEDLDLKNHLCGLRKSYLKISFDTVQQLMHVKNDLIHIVERNLAKFDAEEAYESILTEKRKQRPQDFLDCINDLREYDVPYHVRFAIDNDLRCGQWYDVSVSSAGVTLDRRTDLLQRAEVHVCAFDIETTKLPLKFPDAEYDSVMMISYMVDGQGYLIINRECVGEDIEDLEYTPKPEFEGCFKVTNVKNEEELLRLWFSHMQEVKPGIYVTYNGDFFDWPFLENRAAHHGLRMNDELGFQCDKNQGECRAKFACHLDCFAWVKRDSYLPQGSQGLKMMASYSVSDAVATYYLYMTYVHPFIFSLATIIPMPPDEVLRKGSGTLCEMLLMVQAYKANVICPNKHQSDPEKFYNNQLLESETYIGGHVECLESGVFRSDLPTSFKLDPSAYEQLINNLDRDLQYAIRVEGKLDLESVLNYEEVKNAIMEKLMRLKDEPILEEFPLIYHLDVAAMYPNIILTNRLQPPSIVTDEVCTACDFNRPGKKCLRKLEWVWRGETYMAKRSDYHHLKRQLESELVDSITGQLAKSFLDLPKAEQQMKLKERLKKYCQKAYKRVLNKPVTELREAGICMRENSFYIDTVRSFRDRRYEYKGLNKVWKGKLSEAKSSGNSIKIQEAQDMVVLYDSLQLAHKCILNSFYGYVMRKGARWYSMEMAGVVTYTGAKIIQNARLLVERIGRPLELDTDGIWCALPGSFPENFTFKTKDPKKKLTISYPCVMLNVDVAINNTNDQYQTLKDPVNMTYVTHSECSIEFEVDGPYKAMILPASKEEGILIKKRYAVFNDDGTLAELKGFEIKRRGELKLIKVFQAELFDKFLHGSTLEECYSAVASVANRWLDLLDNQGKDVADSELLDYISESSTMSKSLADYGEQKSCAVTTAKRLADFLGDAMVKDKGLHCQYVVACEPKGTPVSERAVPVAIFETNAEIMKFYVKKWCKISSDIGIRSIIDWSYYKQRLSSAIQKIITIPAAMQKIANPVPRVVHPDWLYKRVREKEDKFRQRKLVDIFSVEKRDDAVSANNDLDTTNHKIGESNVIDLEDFRSNRKTSLVRPRPIVHAYGINNEMSRSKTSFQVESPEQIDFGGNGCMASKQPLQTVFIKENIDRNVDYEGWLELRKRKWKETREKRKRQRLDNSSTFNLMNGVADKRSSFVNHKQPQGKTGVNSYFERHDLALMRSHWQIIQIVPSSQHGHYFAWAVIDGNMCKIPILVPRVFYLNSKAPVTEEFPGRCVNKILPHGRHSYNLIEVIIDEDQFKSESKKLAAHLADPEVELMRLKDEPILEEFPLIYHLDVAAMYPNIILTNRLQPPSIVTDEVCTACDFNRPGKKCLRKLEWVWRGETYMAKRSDYHHLKRQLESELVDSITGQLAKSFLDLPKAEQQMKLKERLKKYCQKAYKRVLNKPVTELREAGICMRENSFYIDTVRSFRDRRYEYKGLNKVWKGKLSEAKSSGNSIKIQEAQDMVVLYDSLQLAHKCILNSFYGYVMRKGARWYSMEMAGVVTYTGAKIIQNARLLVERIGRPLELDTDGIWCALPGSFPENFTFKTKYDFTCRFTWLLLNLFITSYLILSFIQGHFGMVTKPVLTLLWIMCIRDPKKKLTISYPCVMLNVDVAINNTNDQYQTLKDPVNMTYVTHSECSIEFEVDGPYKAMILPASKEEGILIKKRYAVFNDDGTLAELKGFEIKRRGELKLIKVFQLDRFFGRWIIIKQESQHRLLMLDVVIKKWKRNAKDVRFHKTRWYLSWQRIYLEARTEAELFDKFLHGSTLEECYSAVASVANRWLDLLDNQGKDVADSELLDYISESSTMSKSLADYGEQKSCAVTTAKRLADFLGDAMVKDKGLHCQYVVACEPKVCNSCVHSFEYYIGKCDNDNIISKQQKRNRSQEISSEVMDVPDDVLGHELLSFGTPVSERAVPVAIFETNAEIMKFYVKKWCKISSDIGIRSIIDWSYYKQRLSSAIQKIITIPAAMQKIANPVPRVVHPDWLYKRVREKEDKFRQRKLVDIFSVEKRDDAVSANNDLDTTNHKIGEMPLHTSVLVSPLSLLLLQSTVMQKVFALLMSEFRKLGASIVFASFKKVIINTGKSDLSAAKAYCDSILKTIQTRELFEWIELEPLQFWSSLLFMDQYNYGGIQARLKDRSAEENSEVNIESCPDESQVEIVSSWNIAENLPKATQDHFILIVSEFLYEPWKYAQEQAASRAHTIDDLCTPSITAATAEILESQMNTYLKKEIGSYFSDKLLKIVCDPSLHKSDHPISTGSSQPFNNIHKGDPALDFIKYICAVLALDQNVQHEVLIMRRNLLKLVRIREFAPEAEFQNLSMTLTLPNIICSYCNDCRDLDLCSDRALVAQEWRCAVPQCGQPYDREVMENALLQIIRQRERLFHLQDLVCLKCNQIKAAHLSEHCACAGSFRCKEDSSEFRNKMQVFLNVAVDQKFQLLEECVSWILEVR